VPFGRDSARSGIWRLPEEPATPSPSAAGVIWSESRVHNELRSLKGSRNAQVSSRSLIPMCCNHDATACCRWVRVGGSRGQCANVTRRLCLKIVPATNSKNRRARQMKSARVICCHAAFAHRTSDVLWRRKLQRGLRAWPSTSQKPGQFVPSRFDRHGWICLGLNLPLTPAWRTQGSYMVLIGTPRSGPSTYTFDPN
jgi:hypothetical protein